MYILIVAVVLLLALLAVKFSNRYGIPSFLLFISIITDLWTSFQALRF